MSNESKIGTPKLGTLTPWWDMRALEGTRLVKLRQNAMLRRGEPSLYWPLRRDTDSKLWPYAVACVETALSLSDLAVAIYAQIVEAWELPGCQSIKQACSERWPDIRAWLDTMREAYANKGDCPLGSARVWIGYQTCRLAILQ